MDMVINCSGNNKAHSLNFSTVDSSLILDLSLQEVMVDSSLILDLSLQEVSSSCSGLKWRCTQLLHGDRLRWRGRHRVLHT